MEAEPSFQSSDLENLVAENELSCVEVSVVAEDSGSVISSNGVHGLKT